jgi:hypothetical protein
MFIATIVLAVLLAAVYGFSGAQKLTATADSLKQAEHLGVSPGLNRTIGTLEVLAAAGLLIGLAIWPLGVAASAGLVLLMIGAVVMHLRAKDGAARFTPALVLAVIALIELILRAAST